MRAGANCRCDMSREWLLLAAVLGGAVVLHGLSAVLLRILAREGSVTHRYFERWLAASRQGPIVELNWLHRSIVVMVWAGALLLGLRLGGREEQAWQLFQALFTAGFDVAGFRLVPMRLLLGLLSSVLLLGLARGVRARLNDTWLQRSGWDPSARESVATLAGYALMVLAVLIGLSVAGVNLTNLAIIAGALSVGIGFGLQNIVNNFISGLILLSERPVRRGDYVRVGEVEGEVRKIHIRATEIETLDRVSVVVPNSELIASPVQNWRLRDPYIRIVIPVGVAYGSDTDKVRDLLLEVGKAHELTLPDGTPGVPDTHVYFTNFGESSLDFELRTFIRDVNRRGRVASDLRFAIDRVFREHDVTIPFPQRDVWMKTDVEQ